MRSVLLLLCAALIWGTAILTRAPQRQQELRVLVTARNMVEAGDGLHFEFQNQPRYRKPPLAYWVAASGFAVTGQTTSAWAGRLFFVLAALAGLWIFRSLAGNIAGVLLLFTYGSLVYAPLAETDFLQLTGVILAFWSWKRSNGLLSGLGMAMAVLSKGPGGIAIPILCFLILQKQLPRSSRFWVPAILLPCVAGGGWMLYLQTDPVASAALTADLSATFLNTDHSNPLLYYVWTFPLVMIPACFLLPWISSSKPVPEKKIAITWFWVTFLLLTLTVSKQRHYAILLLPPACWWLGIKLSWQPIGNRVLGFCTLGVILVMILVSRFSEDGRHARFLDQSKALVDQADTLHVVGINSARFDFHLGRHVENTDSVQHAYDRAIPGDAVLLVQKAESWEQPEGLPAPILEGDDAEWFRRVYLKKER